MQTHSDMAYHEVCLVSYYYVGYPPHFINAEKKPDSLKTKNHKQ